MFDSILGILPTTITNAELDMNSLAYLHNKERIQVGIGELELNSLLVTSATNKADAMLESDCWDHYCPPGTSPWNFFNQVGYKYVHAGENLGEGFTDNSSLMRAWMNSPTHKANVIKPEYKEFGIGFASGTFQGRDDNTIAVVHFGARAELTPTPVATATPVVTQTPQPTPLPTVVQTQIPTPTATATLLPTQTPTPVPVTPTPMVSVESQPTPIITTIETLTEERAPDTILDSLTINYPKEKTTYTEPIKQIYGEADPGISKVKLLINGKLIMSTAVSNANYIFETTEGAQLELYDGNYEIQVVGENATGDDISESKSIVFSVKIDQPIVSQDDIKVEELIQEDEEIKVIISYLPIEIEPKSVWLQIGTEKVEGIKTSKLYEFETTKTKISAAEEIVLGITATNGQYYELEIEKTSLENDISKIMLKLDFSDKASTVDNLFNFNSGDLFNMNLSFMSLKGKVNLFILVFILSLFVIDYIVINKLLHAKTEREVHHHHLSVGFIVILIIMTLLSSGVGSVAVGLSSN